MIGIIDGIDVGIGIGDIGVEEGIIIVLLLLCSCCFSSCHLFIILILDIFCCFCLLYGSD